ncbi:MAG: prenyltransferase, partial [Merismopedia sp. SIO2A8]|nr:prenyltransferase [Merismopedia sp. SIO2A8]
MTISLADWGEEIVYEPEEEYQAMLRAIQRTQGFGLIFLECTSRQAKQVIDRVQKDITQKSVDVLAFQEPLKDGNVYKQVKQRLSQNHVDVLFIQGLELSLYDYEDTKRHLGWSSEDIYSYSWKGVPPIMVNLNQQREDFRDSFNTCLIFVLPLFAI